MKYSGTGLNAIAFLEAFKGLIALMVAIGAYVFAGQDIREDALHLVMLFHLDPSSYYLKTLLNSLNNIKPDQFTLVIVIAVLYAIIRFVEAYGLWHRLRWTEWFAFLSGAVYVPFELFELARNPNFITAGILVINLVVVGYMYYVLKSNSQGELAKC